MLFYLCCRGSGCFRVRLLYNEQVLPIPGCSTMSAPLPGQGGEKPGVDCDLEEFLALTEQEAQPGIFEQLCGSQDLLSACAALYSPD